MCFNNNLGMSNRLKPYNRLLGQVSDRVLGRIFILFGLQKVQLGSMTLLFSSFLFIISKFYISTLIVKIQLNDNKFKNINLLFTTQYKLFTYQVRDRPFNLKGGGGGVMVFCFVQKFFFGQHES